MKRFLLLATIWLSYGLIDVRLCFALAISDGLRFSKNFAVSHGNESLKMVRYEIIPANATVEVARPGRALSTSNRVRFYAIGDGPYGRSRRNSFAGSLLGIDKSPEFMIHVGDTKGNEKNCTLEHIAFPGQVMREVLNIPAFVIPGDNDWWDCGDHWDRAWDVFASTYLGFDRHWPKPFEVRYQEGRPENFAFTYKSALFLGFHVLSASVRGEWDRWNPMVVDNTAWLTEQFTTYGSEVGAVVMFCHAFPDPKKHKEFYDAIIKLTADFARPVLYLQGDWHSFKVARRFPNPNILHVVLGSIGRKDEPTEVIVDAYAEVPFKIKRNMIAARGG